MARPVAPVPPPPTAHTAAARLPGKRTPWWIAPAAVVGLVLLAWLLLAVLPLDRDEPRATATTTTTETVSEGQAQPSTATMVEVPAGTSDDSFEIATTTIDAPPNAPAPATTTVSGAPRASTTTLPPPMTSAPAAPVQRPPVIVTQTQPPARPPAQPAPVRVVPPPQPSATISEGEAAATLQSYVRSRRYYPVAAECVRIESRGYRNEGYNMEVWHSCAGGGSSRLLGRWRVDAKTREVFVQRDNGRYLKP